VCDPKGRRSIFSLYFADEVIGRPLFILSRHLDADELLSSKSPNSLESSLGRGIVGPLTYKSTQHPKSMLQRWSLLEHAFPSQ
jgi:hypothetical protein